MTTDRRPTLDEIRRVLFGGSLDLIRCDVWEDNAYGDIGGSCRKLRGHDGAHNPFEKITPDVLRETFGLPEIEHRNGTIPDCSEDYVRRAIATGLLDAVKADLEHRDGFHPGADCAWYDHRDALREAYNAVVKEADRV